MKTDLTHLPQAMQADLKKIQAELIPKYSEIEMIILVGSYARGDWQIDEYVENGYTYSYRSDYDLLIVTNNSEKANSDTFLFSLLDRLDELDMETAIHLEVEPIDFVNEMIEKGKSFFVDVKSDGIFLFNTSRYKLAEQRELSPEEKKEIATKDFDEWFKSANMFYEYFEAGFKKGAEDKDYYKTAAFQLHQAAERYYSTIQLVFAGYKPKTHDLDVLGRRAKSLHMEFGKVFPKAKNIERQRFMLLRKAYVDARYKDNYKITKVDLEYLAERVTLLRKLTEQLCKEKIESFTK